VHEWDARQDEEEEGENASYRARLCAPNGVSCFGSYASFGGFHLGLGWLWTGVFFGIHAGLPTSAAACQHGDGGQECYGKTECNKIAAQMAHGLHAPL
jgi:hypothetical protein